MVTQTQFNIMMVAKTLLDERQLVAPKMYNFNSESVFNIIC